MKISKLLSLAVAALMITAFTHSDVIADDRVSAGSLATNLLKSRAQVRILKHDDSVHGGCSKKQKAFAEISVVKAPSRGRNKGKSGAAAVETKWQEDWGLDRCGKKVRYRVFFTDFGDAGAYFAFKLLN
jgi:hypothetical protein